MILFYLWMLVVFVSPLLYIVFALFLIRSILENTKGRARSLALVVVICFFSAYPVYAVVDYVSFRNLCKELVSPEVSPISTKRENMLFLLEIAPGGITPFFNSRYLPLYLGEYEYAGLKKGKVVDVNRCDDKNHCLYIGDVSVSGRYIMHITHPHFVESDPLRLKRLSRIQILDGTSMKVLAEAKEAVYGGFFAAYHGAFLSEHRHEGVLSCGYIDNQVGSWRPGNGSDPRRSKYINADAKFLRAAFPAFIQRN
jgi:hypothetical protein